MRAYTPYTLVTICLVACSAGCSDTGTVVQPVVTGAAGTTSGSVAGAGGTISRAGAPGTAGSAASSGGRAAAAVGGQLAIAGTGTAGTAGAASAGQSAAGASGAAADSGGDAAGAPAAGGGGNASPSGAAGTDPLPPLPPEKALPIVFVHGFAGSAQQFQSQAMRFIANGYAPERIRAYDHDGAGFDSASFVPALEQLVDEVLAEHKTDKVFLIGHSRGTYVSSSFLGDARRAAKVAKYIAIDGSACVSNVPCIAPTQAMFSGQKHVEVCTSKESFAMQYEFLLGEKPQVVDVVRQKAPVEIAGRAVNFPANTGRAGATLKIYEIDSATGARTKADPLATFPIGADGNWGPTIVDPDMHYEMELSAGTGVATHFYAQRFLRSTKFVRLLSGPPDSSSRMNTNVSDMHATLVAARQREWLESDVIEVSTKSPSGDQPVVNAMTRAAGEALSIGIQIHDDAASPRESSLDALPYFSSQAFQYGVDVFMPAADPPNGTITLRNLPRGDMAKPQVINVPNWQSSKHHISISFSDFPLLGP